MEYAGEPRFDPTVKFKARVVRWYSDEPQPGMIEVSVRDAAGRDHRLIDKWVYFLEWLDPDGTYPFEIWIDAEVVDEADDTVVVVLPWQTETVTGETRLALSRSDIESLPSQADQ